MLITEKLILVELHKAGSARLKKVLGDVLGGESSKDGKHAAELAALGKPIVGYVCNPLTWYLAQWRQGCAGKGDIHRRLTNDAKWGQLKTRQANKASKEGGKESGKEGAKPNPKALPDDWSADYAKTQWYASEENELAFREWLQAVLAMPSLRRLIDHGYGSSPMARLGGLMTYDFFISFVRDAENMDKSVDSMEALQAAHEAGKVTTDFIGAESIAADARSTLQRLGVKIDDVQGTAIDALKARTGADDAAVLRFYDAPSLKLVAKREAFINTLFGYTVPTAADRAAARVASKKAAKKAGRKGEGQAGGEGGSGAKPDKAAKQMKRTERKANAPGEEGAADPGKKVKATKNASTKAAKPGKAHAAAADKPQKLKRVKNLPAGGDVVDADE